MRWWKWIMGRHRLAVARERLEDEQRALARVTIAVMCDQDAPLRQIINLSRVWQRICKQSGRLARIEGRLGVSEWRAT